jgi:hypothetical protein
LDDSEFLSQITHQDLKAKYRKLARQEISRANAKFFDSKEEIEKEHLRQFETGREHDRIINTCVYPFVETDLSLARLGYRFIRAAPLLELGTKNIDFLLFRRSGSRPVAIFGEAKGSITNFSQVLTEMEERKKAVESNLGYIKSEYLDTGLDPICEYVLAVKSSLGIKAKDAILESGNRVILWQVDYLHHKLSLGQAPREQPDRRLMTHADSELNAVLGHGDGISSYENTFAFYPQSHILVKLLAIVPVLEREQAGNVLRPFKLRQYLSTQLSYLSEDRREAELNSILAEAQRIKFAFKIPEEADFLVPSKSRARASIEDELKHKWLKQRLDEIRSKEVEEARARLQAVVMEEQRRQPTLFSDEGFSVGGP